MTRGVKVDISHLTSEEQQKVLEARERQAARSKKTNAELKELRRVQRTGERSLNLLEKMTLAQAKIQYLKGKVKYKEVVKQNRSDKRKAFLEETLAKERDSARKFRKENPGYYTEYKRQWKKSRRKSDLNFKISENLRSRTYSALMKQLSGEIKGGSAVEDLGCAIDELVSYLEGQFQLGMSWENYGTKGLKSPEAPWWSIDHIVPLRLFDLTDREQFLKACHYTNLQPLWHAENLRKSDWIEKDGVQLRARDIRKKAA